MSFLEIPSGERQDLEYLADLFASVVAIEQLEKAQRREYITADQYTASVGRLLQKYQHTVRNLSSTKNPIFTSSEDFLNEYCSKYHAARHTILSGPVSLASDSKLYIARHVMDCTQLFITLLDALRLQQTSVDRLNPLLADLLSTLNKLHVQEKDFYQHLLKWHQRLNEMNAADVLDADGIRQLEYDLERGYSELRSMVDAEQH